LRRFVTGAPETGDGLQRRAASRIGTLWLVPASKEIVPEFRRAQQCLIRRIVTISALVLTAGCSPTPSPQNPITTIPNIEPAKAPIKAASTLPNPLIHQVRPVYPKAAKKAHIEGTVRFDAVISATGELSDIHLVSGNPMLVPVAMDAVKQWRYAPTLLNGELVEVKTTIDVNFTLSQ
jgi:TonB family protein